MNEEYKNMFGAYPDIVTVEQLGEMLGGVSKKTVYKLIKEGKIGSVRVGRSHRIPKANVIQYLIDSQVK